MPRNSFIQMTKLPNVRGRITYITSHAKQENLYAVYETTDRSFWTELAKCNQAEFKKSGTEGKCIEARELIIALPESFVDHPPNQLLQFFTDHFKQQYGTDCIAALHHNKRKTNYHIHLIFSERILLPQPMEKIATRSMFYDELGKHVCTKKEILDGEGNIRKGCKVIKKGEVYERQIFSVKDKHFKDEGFLDEVKRDYTGLINQFVKDEKQKLQVFERGGMYLATKKIGKNNPKAEEIKADNEKRAMWNQTVDRAIVTGVAKADILQIKKEQITDKVSESVKDFGDRPNMLSSIISSAIAVLELVISKVFRRALGRTDKAVIQEPEQKPKKPGFWEYKAEAEQQRVSEQLQREQIQQLEPPKPTIPPRPKPSKEAASYKRLCEIDKKLKAQNNAIFAVEQQRNELEGQLAECKGIFKAGRRSELSRQIADKNERIANMKNYLMGIAMEYSFQNVEEFYKAFYKTQKVYAVCRAEQKAWDKKYEEKSMSLYDKLKTKKKEATKNETDRSHRYTKDRGAR
jgi:hypothetical protein